LGVVGTLFFAGADLLEESLFRGADPSSSSFFVFLRRDVAPNAFSLRQTFKPPPRRKNFPCFSVPLNGSVVLPLFLFSTFFSGLTPPVFVTIPIGRKEFFHPEAFFSGLLI